MLGKMHACAVSVYQALSRKRAWVGGYFDSMQTSQLSLFHSETQGFWSILKVIPSNLTVKMVSLTQSVEPNHPKLG